MKLNARITPRNNNIIKLFSFLNVYIVLWALYWFQNVLLGVEEGSLFTRFLVVALLLVSLYHAFYVYANYKLPSMMKALTALILMFTIYGLEFIISGRVCRVGGMGGSVVANYEYLKTIYISLLPIYSFYYFAKKGQLTEQLFPVLAILLLVLVVLSMEFQQQQMLNRAFESGSSQEEFTNNTGYFFLALIPLISLLYKKQILQYLLLAISFTMLVICMKRGAILIGFIVTIFFIFYNTKASTRWNRLWTVLGSIMVLIVAVWIYNYMMNSSDFFNIRVEQTSEGNSSGRDYLFSTFLNHFLYKTTPFQLLLGGGANYTLTVSNNYAHNDWLEIAVNQGILGIIVYLIFFISFFLTWRKSRFSDPHIKITMGCLFISLFMKTLFSMSYGSILFYEALPLGYCLSYVGNTQIMSRA